MKTLLLTAEEDRARLVLRRLMAYTETTGAELARRTGMLAQSVSERVNGKVRLGITDMFVFADALGVEPSLFLMEPDDALRSVMDHAAVPVTVGGGAKASSRRQSACVTAADSGRFRPRRHPVAAVRGCSSGRHAFVTLGGFHRVTRW